MHTPKGGPGADRSRRRGATGLSYALILGLVVFVSVAVISRLGTAVTELFGGVSSTLAGAGGGGGGAGEEEEEVPATYASCAEAQEDVGSVSGPYTIAIPGLGETPLYCDLETNGGGWTLISTYSGTPDGNSYLSADGFNEGALDDPTPDQNARLSDATIAALLGDLAQVEIRGVTSSSDITIVSTNGANTLEPIEIPDSGSTGQIFNCRNTEDLFGQDYGLEGFDTGITPGPLMRAGTLRNPFEAVSSCGGFAFALDGESFYDQEPFGLSGVGTTEMAQRQYADEGSSFFGGGESLQGTTAVAWYARPASFERPAAVSSITRESPSARDTNSDSLTFRVTFSGQVQGVDAADLAVSGTTTAVDSVVDVGDSTSFLVTITDNSPGDDQVDGDLGTRDNNSITLGFAGSQDITDTNGRAISTGTPPTNEDFRHQLGALTSITRFSPSNEVTDAASITFELTFSEPVVLEAADLQVTGTTTGIDAVQSVGDGSVWRVTVTDSDPASNLVDGDLGGVAAAIGIELAPGGSIEDLGGAAISDNAPATIETYTRISLTPTIVGEVGTSDDQNFDRPRVLDIRGNLAVVGATNGGISTAFGSILTIDISDRTSPRIQGVWTSTGLGGDPTQPEGVAIDDTGNTVWVNFLNSGDAEIRAVDISTVTAPVPLAGAVGEASVSSFDQAQDIVVEGGNIWLNSTIGDGVVLIDGSTPANPFEQARINSSSLLDGVLELVKVDETIWVFAQNRRIVRAIDASDPASLSGSGNTDRIETTSFSGDPLTGNRTDVGGFEVSGGIGVLSYRDKTPQGRITRVGIAVLDLSNPSSPSLITDFILPFLAEEQFGGSFPPGPPIDFDGTNVWIANQAGDGTLVGVDLSSPANPTVFAVLTDSRLSVPVDIDIEGDTVWVLGGNSDRLIAVDVGN